MKAKVILIFIATLFSQITFGQTTEAEKISVQLVLTRQLVGRKVE